MPHDQLFKELLKAFFREFLELFFPEVAARLDFARVEFLDKELFTDLPEGTRREPDVLARVYTLDGVPELILLHIEVQAKRERHFPQRMYQYYALLRLRFNELVFPAVVYLAPGAGGLTHEEYEERLFNERILSFRYWVVGLPDLPAHDYEEGTNPLAPALSALMKARNVGRVARKAQALRRTLAAQVDEARKSLLVYVIDTYLPSSEAEQQELRRIVGAAEAEQMVQYVTSFERNGRVIGKREAVLKLLRYKFGSLPEEIEERLAAIHTEPEMDRLMDLALEAGSLQDLQFPE